MNVLGNISQNNKYLWRFSESNFFSQKVEKQKKLLLLFLCLEFSFLPHVQSQFLESYFSPNQIKLFFYIYSTIAIPMTSFSRITSPFSIQNTKTIFIVGFCCCCFIFYFINFCNYFYLFFTFFGQTQFLSSFLSYIFN